MSNLDVKGLYEQYAFLIHARCRRILGSGEDAHDAVQVVFAKLLADAATVRDPGRVVPWIYRAAQNHCFNVLRDRKKLAGAADPDEIAAPGDHAGSLGDRQIIRLALEAHNRRVREAVYFTYIEQLSQEEICRITGQSPATIRRNLRRFEKSLPGLRKRLGL
jgi:RNA polymerase sigma-70 factor (ECF subfamily)